MSDLVLNMSGQVLNMSELKSRHCTRQRRRFALRFALGSGSSRVARQPYTPVRAGEPAGPMARTGAHPGEDAWRGLTDFFFTRWGRLPLWDGAGQKQS
jgi:hypothetical protein